MITTLILTDSEVILLSFIIQILPQIVFVVTLALYKT